MTYDLKDFKLTSRIQVGDILQLIFENVNDQKSGKVLELVEVVGLLDHTYENDLLDNLRIDKEGGSYNFDLSLRLGRPEIAKFQEAFLFTDSNQVSGPFRAAARKIIFRDWIKTDKWLK